MNGVSFKRFEVAVKGVGVFPDLEHIRIVWAGADSESMIRLAGIVDDSMNKVGFGKESRPFTPHLTLGRVKSNKVINGLRFRVG